MLARFIEGGIVAEVCEVIHAQGGGGGGMSHRNTNVLKPTSLHSKLLVSNDFGTKTNYYLGDYNTSL
jgi:hypothetical protein